MHNALITGEVLLMGSDNPQPDELSCCASCLEREGCTAWVYCPVKGGCTAEGSSISLVSNGSTGLVPAPEEQKRQLQLPYLGCRLLSIPAFTLHTDSPQILAKGPAVQFSSGELGHSGGRRGGMPWAGTGDVLGSTAPGGCACWDQAMPCWPRHRVRAPHFDAGRELRLLRCNIHAQQHPPAAEGAGLACVWSAEHYRPPSPRSRLPGRARPCPPLQARP